MSLRSKSISAMRFLPVALVAFWLIFPLSPLLAPGACAKDTRTAAADAPASTGDSTIELKSVLEKKGKITLEGYLHAVDKYYPKLLAADSKRKISDAIRMETRGPFDPVFSNGSGYTRMQNTSRIGVPKQALFNDPKLEILMREGIRVWTQYRFNPETAQSPYIETGSGGEYSYGLMVPLMRNLYINEQSAAERQAKLGVKLATQTFSLTRLDTLLRGGVIYWNWVGAKQKSDIQHSIVELANILASISKQQEQAGDLARIFVSEAEEDVARRNAEYVRAVREFQHVSFDLSMLLFDIGGIPLPLPTEENVPDEIAHPTLISENDKTRNIEMAINLRPELKAIDLERGIAKVQLQLSRNQILPQVDATFTQGYDTGFRGIGHVFRGQINVSQPIGMHRARGQAEGARLRIEQLEQEKVAATQRIRNEVLDAISAVNLAYQRCQQLEKQVEKAEEVYQGEQERFKAGDSTVFLVTQRERQLVEAKIQLIDAQVEWQLGSLALRIITCQI